MLTCSHLTAKPKKRQAPKIVRKFEETIERTEGDSVTLVVEVTGEPEPTVHWMRGDTEITSETPGFSVAKEANVHTLHIESCKPNMAALYNCRIENLAGTTSCRSRLKVKREFLKVKFA